MIDPAAPALSGRAPRGERRPGVEASLIAAVERLLADGTPFADIGVGRLAKEAGISRATFYLYFPDRTQFVLRLADHLRDRIVEPLSLLWSGGAGDRTALETALRALVFDFREHGAAAAAVLETAATDPVIAARLQEAMDAFVAATTTALELGQAAGLVRSELPVAETAAALSWMVERTCYQVARDADDASLERLATALSAIAWHTLTP
jgi:AcrR family transcriptional regulator